VEAGKKLKLGWEACGGRLGMAERQRGPSACLFLHLLHLCHTHATASLHTTALYYTAHCTGVAF
jgi:hypothetical protein